MTQKNEAKSYSGTITVQELNPYAGISETDIQKMIDELKPPFEPRNPCTTVFWKRHLGTDALIGNWLWLIGSGAYLAYAILMYVYSTTVASKVHYACQIAMASLFLVGAVYWLMVSYPEVALEIFMETLTLDVDQLTFSERYFTGSKMLMAMWFFAFSPLVLYVYAVYMIITAPRSLTGYVWIIGIFVFGFLPLFFFAYISLPENVQKNGGKGTTVIFDHVIQPCRRCYCVCGFLYPSACDNRSDVWWKRHFQADWLSLMWIVTALMGLSMLYYIFLIFVDFSITNFCLFICDFGFFFGSWAFALSLYGDNNSSHIWDLISCTMDSNEDESDQLLSVPVERPY